MTQTYAGRPQHHYFCPCWMVVAASFFFCLSKHCLSFTIPNAYTATIILSDAPQRLYATTTKDATSIGTHDKINTDEKNLNFDSVETRQQSHYKWLIIGGGIHGVGIATRLLGGDNNVSLRDLLVVDEHPSLLYSWKTRTKATGMKVLRSAAGFHLDLPPHALRTFDALRQQQQQSSSSSSNPKRSLSKKAKRQSKNNQHKSKHGNGPTSLSNGLGKEGDEGNASNVLVGRDYQRPSLQLFNDHCDAVIEKYHLNQSFQMGRVESIRFDDDESNSNESSGAPLKVLIRNQPTTTETEPMITTVSAENIVLAIGNDDPVIPDWAQDILSLDDYSHEQNIHHLLDLSSSRLSSRNTTIATSSNTSTDPTQLLNRQNNAQGCQEQQHTVAIIGGGISAVHKALELISSGDSHGTTKVHIVSRHPIREQQFDTHQDWMMTQELAERSLSKGGQGLTKRQRKYEELQNPNDRREIIRKERIPGTVPTYMTRARGGLEDAIRAGTIEWHIGSVESVTPLLSSPIVNKDVFTSKQGKQYHSTNAASRNKDTPSKDLQFDYQINLTSKTDPFKAQEIILATGLGKNLPGQQWIKPLAELANLPLSPCGYPLVDSSLRWVQKPDGEALPSSVHSATISKTRTQIFVAGGLAELELGPSARNIAGARMAAERIARTVRKHNS